MGFTDPHKRVKVFEKECPTINHIMVYDIRTSGKDELESHIYASSLELQYNLRKGHTIVEVYDPEDFNIKKYSLVARKGPRKYYTLRLEDLQDDDVYFSIFDASLASTEEERKEIIRAHVLRNYALAPVFNSISEGKRVEVFRSTFTIGEHAQISWMDSEMTWVIANEHASMFVRDLTDIDTYNPHPKSPYLVTAKIAAFWLKFFDDKVSDKVGFQKAVDGKTLCATFVNNAEFDSLVEYDRPALIFHAIVENEVHDTTCLPPDQSYAFFQKWGLDTAPLTSVGDYDNFDDVMNSLIKVHRSISNSLVKDEELGAVIYFVEKGDNDDVLSMAKIETKESMCLLFLVKVLRDFWKSKENIKTWDSRLDSEYNNSFQVFMFFLEHLNIQDFEGYMAVAQAAYKFIKEDMDLYYKLKLDIPKFLSFIYKKVGYSPNAFKSSVLNYSYESDQSNNKAQEETKECFVDEEIEVPREEDAIDRLMKNEYIRKNSKIDYEEQPLENIIGSQKNTEKAVSPTKNQTKKRKKNTLAEKKEFAKLNAQNANKNEKPKRQGEQIKINPKISEKKETKQAEKTVSKHKEPITIDESDEPEASITSIKMVLKATDSKLISPDKIQRHLILNNEWEVVSNSEEANVTLEQLQIDKHSRDHYFALNLSGEHIHDQIHVLPVYHKLSDTAKRVYSASAPFGLRRARKIIKINGQLKDCVFYEHILHKNLIHHMFSAEGAWNWQRAVNLKSYKTNSYLYFKNVDPWFARFRII